MDLFLYYANRAAVVLLALICAFAMADYFGITPWALLVAVVIFMMPKFSLILIPLGYVLLRLVAPYMAAVWNGAAHVAVFGARRDDPEET